MNDERTVYETAKAIRQHLEHHLENVTAYQDETRVLYERLQTLSRKLYLRFVTALEAEERLGRHVARNQNATKDKAA